MSANRQTNGPAGAFSRRRPFRQAMLPQMKANKEINDGEFEHFGIFKNEKGDKEL